MTGPEHYEEAERLIDEANHVGHQDADRADGIVRAAQVHATLAVAAATAWTGWEDGEPDVNEYGGRRGGKS